MVNIKAFRALRPAPEYAAATAALPYDVYDRKEAKKAAEGKLLTFLRIDRPETAFPEDTDMYSEKVYAEAARLFHEDIKKGYYIKEEKPCLYLYSLTMAGRTQTGLVCCVSVDDYLSGNIKKHENTVREKEEDRVRHIEALNAQTGPIFLSYRRNERLSEIIGGELLKKPVYDFSSEDGVRHRVWRIGGEDVISSVINIFSGETDAAYIADGHHRAASAVRAALKKREENSEGGGSTHEYDYFLSVLFPDDELNISDYNRVVRDLNGLCAEEILAKIGENFEISETESYDWRPSKKGETGMYISKNAFEAFKSDGDIKEGISKGKYYKLSLKGKKSEEIKDDPVRSLDASVLQDLVFEPVFGIKNPRADKRLEFVGGIKGAELLSEKAEGCGGAAFLMHPVSMKELMDVADEGLLMPPKSTWFEPKLRSGLFIHEI